jgi:hypothetical protein
MRGKFSLRIMISVISVFMLLAVLACALSFGGLPSRELITIPVLGGEGIRNPEIASKYGITGYLEITYPSDSPSLPSIDRDRGGEININILLHFVSHTPEVTNVQVNIDPKNPRGYRIEQGDVIFNELVSYSPSGNIVIKAGETIPVIMSIRVPENLPWYIEAIPLGAMGIEANAPIISEIGEKEVAING